ncbi:MAG: hypothetical protein AAF266_06390 [Planctomycetota bacterium]
MGWKCSFVVATESKDAQLASGPMHKPSLADQIASTLGDFIADGTTTFEEGCYPSDGRLYIGAYDGSIIVGDLGIGSEFMEVETPTELATLRSFLPKSDVLAFQLQSVVNWYGYAYYKRGNLDRLRVGCADEGVLHDLGNPLPEEEPLFAKSYVNADGEQVWPFEYNGETDEMDHSSMGEEFVFEVSRRVFGERFDSFDHSKLAMSAYRKRRGLPWRWFLGP